LKNSIGEDIISLQVSDGEKFSDTLTNFEFIKRMDWHEDFLYLSVENGETMIPRLMALAHKEGVSVQSVSLRKPTLEDVFLHFTGKTIREQEASVKEQVRMQAKARMKRR
jgi:ABC-2 type transport system ATP-binding protein